ncbi:serpin family protein [Simkania sp.]|uniref:serpin family protein n=1 Tax=Simkania sp. TaxID=34094 RepID=UPI003B516C36
MKRALLIVLVFLFGACGSLESTLSKNTETLINDLNQAAFLEFYLIKKGHNPLVSPYSIQSSLLMAYMGARGQTAKEMAQVLSMTLPQEQLGDSFSQLTDYLLAPKSEQGYKLKIGNGMWIDDNLTVLSTYKKTVADDFNGDVQQIDFGAPTTAVETINAWVSEETDNAINHFLSPQDINPSTVLLLTNGLLLKGPWASPFNSKLTESKPFLTSKNVSLDVPTMHQIGMFPYYEDDNFQILALPLLSENNQAELAMLIFLPKQTLLTDVFDFFYAKQQQSPENFLDLINKFENTQVNISLPKFAFNKRSFLKNFFLSIGMKDAFSRSADFSGITGSKNIYISNAFHESFLKIDEGGIFAAAASGVQFNLKSALPDQPPRPFNANHPFFYCIADLKTKLLLFMGVLNDPSLSDNGDKPQ